jgi:hypothetical protein
MGRALRIKQMQEPETDSGRDCILYADVSWYDQNCIYACSNVARVNEYKPADEDVKSKYKEFFMETSILKRKECMRDVLYDVWRHPGYALNMILQRKLDVMIAVSAGKKKKDSKHIFEQYENQCLKDISQDLGYNPEQIFEDYAEYTYYVELNPPSLKYCINGNERNWTIVPLDDSIETRKALSEEWTLLFQNKEETNLFPEKREIWARKRKALRKEWKERIKEVEKLLKKGPKAIF